MTADPDLDGFRAWLSSRPYSTATQHNYTKAVKIAHASGVSDPDGVDAVFEHRGRRGYRQHLRTALRAYADFREAAA